MRIKNGLISADSHVVTEPDAFLSRMSKAKFGDRIPQIKELEIKGANVERWFVNGRPLKTRGVCNCPAVMGDPLPQDDAPGTRPRCLTRHGDRKVTDFAHDFCVRWGVAVRLRSPRRVAVGARGAWACAADLGREPRS